MLYYSGIQCAELGRPDSYFHALGLTWVVTNYEITINRMPTDNEKLTITTEAKAYNKFFTYREFQVLDEKGNLLVTLETTFALMKLADRKLGSLTAELLEPFEAEKVNTIKRAPKIPKLTAPISKSYEVRYSDLDANQHVNNTKYLEWSMDTLGMDFLTSHNITYIHVRFVKEISYGQVVECLADIGENQTIHQILVDGTLHFECAIDWKKRGNHEI